MYIMKHNMLDYLLTKQLDTFGLPSQVKEKMREVLANHKSYRAFLNPIAAGGEDEVDNQKPGAADLSWRGDWSRSAIMYLSFVERCVYGDDFDATLRTACKMGKGPADVVQYDSFVSALNAIRDMQTKEQEEQQKLAAGLVLEEAAKNPAAAPVAGGGAAVAATEEGEGATDQRLQLEAERIVNSKVTLLIEPDSQAELKSAIMSSLAGKVEGREGSEYVVIIYDYKQAAESKTSPATRRAPLRDGRATKCIVATLDARRTTMGHAAMGVVPGDMYFLFDGTRSGNVSKLKAGFVNENGEAIPKAERRLVLVYAEDGAARRRQLVRGTGSVKQQEGLLLVTRFKPKMNRRKRLHFEGTSAGDAIVHIPAPDDEWQITMARKRQLYAQYRVEVGGKEGSDDEEDEEEVAAEVAERAAKKKRIMPPKKDEEELEPVFYFQPARSLVEELLHLSQARAVIDLSAGAGVWALAAVENNIPYFGVVLTDVHLTELTSHLIRQVKVKLTTPTSKLYMAFLASQVQPEPAPQKPKEPKKAEPKAKAKQDHPPALKDDHESSADDSHSPAQ